MMQKDILWRAAILAAIVFVTGIAIGIWLDEQRVSLTRNQLTDIDLQWNDARLTALYYQLHAGADSNFCGSAIDSNLAFNDRIYQQGLTIERYETTNRFVPEILQEKRRYALLQLQFLLNSIELKKTCNASYHTIVYFYSNYDESLYAAQDAQSAVLGELKNMCGPQLMLSPLPLDMNISTISLMASQYNITKAPSLLVDGRVLTGLTNKMQLQPLLNCSS